ncbi:hypothetical protein [Bacillus phage SDFMU_Pbc]|uniref:Uncharacterized protein n=1 Tax=Bacillus phage SDFMU_Pbc TaxID=3076135 RepID=A0AA96R1C6_9CAUD|nr:hypothetical protein [Bacillus phage SDFMU_Pbc]
MISLNNFEYDKGENLQKLTDTSGDFNAQEELKNEAEHAWKKFMEDLKQAENVAIDTAVSELLAEIGITPPQDSSPEEVERVRSAVAAQSLDLGISNADISRQEKKYTRTIYLSSAVTNELIAERQVEITWTETEETQK